MSTCPSSPISSRAALAGGLLVASLILLACASDGGTESKPTVVPPAPSAAVELAGGLPLERFHYDAKLTLKETEAEDQPGTVVVSTEGDFQWPDRHAFTYTIGFDEGAVERSVVIIGETVWFRQGEEPWRKTTRDDPQVADLLDVAFSAVRPRFLGGPDFQRVRESVRALPSSEALINDVPAYHYRVDSAGKEFFEAFLADEQALQTVQGLQWDLWLAKDGAWPVRLLVSGTVVADMEILDTLDLQAPTTWELRIDVSRPNDPTLTVLAPEERG